MKTGTTLCLQLLFAGATSWSGATSLTFAQNPLVSVEGLYTDRPGYDPGETVRVRGNWLPGVGADARVKYRLVRFTAAGVTPTGVETPVFLYRGDQVTPFGSFVEFPPALDLAGRFAFTLEGWVQPTLVGDGLGGDDDWTAVAGQLRCPDCPSWTTGAPFPVTGMAGLGVTANGRPFAFVETEQGPRRVVASAPLASRDADGRLAWTYLAASYTGARLTLYVGDESGWSEIASRRARGRVVDRGLPFRLGARAEAPADRAGVFDGRLDDWSVWGVGLSEAQLDARRTARSPASASAEAAPAGRERDALLPLLLRAEFEDPYGPTVFDTSGRANHGTLVNHGTPGMGGHTLASQALRLNHDQVVDAAWSDLAREEQSGAVLPVELPLPAGTPSGLYGVQALVDDGAGFDPANRDPARWQALVVRPAPGAAPAPVALVMPVNTWVAYNGWPGEALRNGTAQGMTQLGGFRQGNNSAYSRMGDGTSPAHYIGWRRPSTTASPFDAPGRRSALAPMNRRFVEWLLAQGGEGVGPRIPFDVYTDWDLDDGRLDVRDYLVLATSGHPEYWSLNMITALTRFTDGDPTATPPIPGGGSLINVGGNAFALRAEIDHAAGLVEIKKWPVLIELVGDKDHESLISGGLTGEFPYIQRCSTPPRSDYRILGTVRDIVVPCDVAPACFGTWKVVNTTHWLWEDPVALNQRLAPDTVGHEFDAFVPGQGPPGGNLTVLAVGTDFGGVSPALSLDWSHPSFTTTTCAELDLRANGNPASPFWASRLNAVTPTGEHGALVAYDHRGGGRVLSLASTHAPFALVQEPRLSRLVYKAFRCFALGLDCP